jgi:hypothetical protein
MSSRQNLRQSAQKSARPPEYVIIRRQPDTQSGQQEPPQPKKTRQSKKVTKYEENENRREQRYRAKRRRQWIRSLGIVVVFIALLALALHFLAIRSTSSPTPAAGSQGDHMNAAPARQVQLARL